MSGHGIAGGIDFDALAEWAGEEVARDAMIESGYEDGYNIGMVNLSRGLLPLLGEIEACGFSCQAGPLENHVAWRKLRALVSGAAA